MLPSNTAPHSDFIVNMFERDGYTITFYTDFAKKIHGYPVVTFMIITPGITAPARLMLPLNIADQMYTFVIKHILRGVNMLPSTARKNLRTTKLLNSPPAC